MPPVQPEPYAVILGRNVKVARVRAGLDQEDVRLRMNELGFTAWRSSTVSLVERGKRRLTCEEALGLMVCLETALEALLYPPPELEFAGILLPAGQETLLPAAKYGYNPDRASAWDGNRCLLKPYPHGGHQEDQLPSVVTAIVTSSRGVLVGRRNDGKPPWTFIAGEQDAVQDESPADTAVREVKEETTLEVEAGDVIGERVHPRTGRHMIYMAARPVRGTEIVVGDEEELAEVRWVSLAECDQLMAEYGMFEPVHDYLERELGGA